MWSVTCNKLKTDSNNRVGCVHWLMCMSGFYSPVQWWTFGWANLDRGLPSQYSFAGIWEWTICPGWTLPRALSHHRRFLGDPSRKSWRNARSGEIVRSNTIAIKLCVSCTLTRPFTATWVVVGGWSMDSFSERVQQRVKFYNFRRCGKKAAVCLFMLPAGS